MDMYKRANELMVEAMKAAENETGYEAAKKVGEYMAEQGHPHASYTRDEIWNGRNGEFTDEEMIKEIAERMASLIAENEMLAEEE